MKQINEMHYVDSELFGLMGTLNIDLFYFDGISNSQIINTTRCLHNISKQLDKFIFMQTS